VIDGLAHILAHRVNTVSGGLQTFHTVVPLEFWQQLQQWAAQQRDHCLVFSLGGLLQADVGAGRARVLRLGRTLHFFGRPNAGFFYASASAIGSTDAHLFAAIRVLAASARVEIDRGIEGPVEWGSVLSTDPQQDARLIAHWGAEGLVPAIEMPTALWRDGAGESASVLPGLVQRAGVRAAVNPPLAQLAWASEALVAGVTVATAVIAFGLLGLGFFVRDQASDQRAAAAESVRLAKPLEARVTAANELQAPVSFGPMAEFARKLGDGMRYDPVPMLGLLRRAAGGDMRIQRLRLETGFAKDRAFLIDGVSDVGGVAGVSSLLSRLRDAGWNAQAVNSQDVAPGAFAYRLTAAPSSAARN
jgi:hypothetical protein